jgi:hypothetical protein
MKKTTFRLLSFLLLIVLLVNVMAPRQASVAQGAIDSRFGAIESFWAPQEAAELGVGWERILFYWNEIQPGGAGDWNTLHVLEEWLTEATGQGRTIVGLLKNTPVWATDGPPFSGVPRGLYLPVDDPGNLWATYVRQVANYYGPRGVHHWIVWNEPDIEPAVYGHEFSGSTQDYYQLVKVAYQVMKQADPNAVIHLGGMTYWHDPSYLRRFLQVAVADPEAAENNYFFDVITYHIYFRPETVWTIVGGGFAVQSELGIPLKPIWVNETNARPSMDPEWPVQVQSFQIDLDQQAWYIPQAYAIGFHAGAARMAVYKLVDINMAPGDESWGLIRPYDFSRRPAYDAYQTTIKYLSGFTYPVRREQGDNHYIFIFNRPEGVTRVMWARNQAAVTLDVPALASSAMLVTAVGEATTITAVNGKYTIHLEGARCYSECYMGGPPLFLVESGVTADTAPPPAAANTPVANVTATAVVAITSTLAAASEITVTAAATPTETTMPTPTATATKRPPETPTATSTTAPTVTTMPTVAVTATVEEIALVVEVTAVPRPVNTTSSTTEPTYTSWWFLGTGVGLAILLILMMWRQRR